MQYQFKNKDGLYNWVSINLLIILFKYTLSNITYPTLFKFICGEVS